MSELHLPLTEKRRRFVAEYLIHCNASRAARTAGYSATSAASIGSELLTMPNVKAAIARGEAERAARRALARATVSQELVPLAGIADWVTIGPDGEAWVDLKRLARDHLAAAAATSVRAAETAIRLSLSQEKSGSLRK